MNPLNSDYSSHQEMIEQSRATALAAADLASRARKTAVEKAAAAAVARAAARRALEVMDSVASIRARKERALLKRRGKAHHLSKKRSAEEVESDNDGLVGSHQEEKMMDAQEMKEKMMGDQEMKEKMMDGQEMKEKIVVHPKLERGGDVVEGKWKRGFVSQYGFRDGPGGETPEKVSAVYGCKEFKVLDHSSDSKMSHTLTTPTAPIMVEVD